MDADFFAKALSRRMMQKLKGWLQELPDGYEVREDGIPYCKTCGEPMQRTTQADGGIPIEHPRRCRCLREKDEAEEAAFQRRKKESDIADKRRLCFDNKERRYYTFEAADNKDAAYMLVAKQYAEDWEQHRADGSGLILWGCVDGGKSYAASCIANALIDRGISVRFDSLSDVFARLDSSFDGRAALFSELAAWPLLILDDLGVERNTETANERVFQIVDSRLSAGKPIIFTTNNSLKDMKAFREDTKDLHRQRLYSRVLGKCIPVHVEGTGRREAEGKRLTSGLKDRLTNQTE